MRELEQEREERRGEGSVKRKGRRMRTGRTGKRGRKRMKEGEKK